MRRVITGNVRFTIKYPTGGRTRFAIERRTYNEQTGKVDSSSTVEHPTIKSVNEAYKAGLLDLQKSKANLQELIEQLYKDEKRIKTVPHNQENLRVVDAYWDAKYRRRDLKDPKTAKYALLRAIEAIGSLSIYSASTDEIQDAVDAKFSGNSQRRIVTSLLQLLKFAKRSDVILIKARKEKRRVKYLTEAEFDAVRKHFKLETLEVLHTVAFYTGGRIGELFALKPEDFNETLLELRIQTQIDKEGLERETKNRRERVALVFPAGVKALKRWFQIKHLLDQETRKHIADITRSACKAEFEDNNNKHLVFHDLRHCYAVQCRERGLSTEDVADLIGDSLVVCKEHYTGFGPSSALMDLRRRAIRKKPNKAA